MGGVGLLLATGEDGAVYSSYQLGSGWTRIDVGTRRNLVAGVGFADGLFFVGDANTIVRGSVPAPAQLRNLSTRGAVGPGDVRLTAGTVIGGAADKRVLIRAAGPTLRSFGVTSALADPVLTVFDGRQQLVAKVERPPVAQRDSLAQAAAAAGAFPLDPDGADAATLATLAPGAYTFEVSSASGGGGEALIEIYDLEPAGTSSSPLVNISTRGSMGPTRPLVAGFVVEGSRSRILLVRAVGPGLRSFGVTNALANPSVAVHRAPGLGVFHGRNDDWETPIFLNTVTTVEALRATEAGLEAFPLANGSRDAAMLVTVPPGAYTAVVSAEGNTAGEALVEIYEVPY